MKQRESLRPESMGLDLTTKKEAQIFKWFLACLLFSKPIKGEIAGRAYGALIRAGITSINKLAKTEWDVLVRLLDEAHYARFDFSTATNLLYISQEMKRSYGTVGGLLKVSESIEDLEERLVAFKGIGPVTAGLFVRGVMPVWFKDSLPHQYDSALHAVKLLDSHGYAVFLIGGAVRDMWLGREPKDFDIVTNATPEQIMAIPEFRKSSYKDTAQAYGVTRVRYMHQGLTSDLEIATFRKDLETELGRRATKVQYADLEDDVLRRDFTINALALDPSTNFIIDFVGGAEDLDSKAIRFIGEAKNRISEDPLRILRAIRFKNHLDFTYDAGTARAIKQTVKEGQIERIPADRIRDELNRLLLHPSRKQAILDLYDFGILKRVLPEVVAGMGVSQPAQYHAEGDVWRHELLMLEYLPEHPSRRLAWAALLHDIGKGPTSIYSHDGDGHIRFDRHYAVGAELAKAILRRLKFSTRDIKDITWMIYKHMSIDDLPAMRQSKQQQMLGHPAFEDLLELHKIDAAASWRPDSPHGIKPKFKTLERLWHVYQTKSPELRQPSLKRDLGIDGSWLIRHFKEEFQLTGPIIGHVLRDLDEWYRDEEVKSIPAYVVRARQLLYKYSGTLQSSTKYRTLLRVKGGIL